MKYTNQLSEIDTENKAYLLGLFYSDGNISGYRNSITSKDHKWLKKVCNHFDFLKYNTTQTTARGKVSYTCKYSLDMKIDLEKNGMHERKSVENADKIYLPKLKEKLIPHFIRGLYDGDGCYYIDADGQSCTIFIGMTNKYLIEDLHKYFKRHDIVFHITKKTKDRKTPIYWLRGKSKKSALNFRDLVYPSEDILCMERKKKIIFSYDPISNKEIYKRRGQNFKGFKHSKETKEKLRQQKLGETLSDKHKNNISKGLKKHYNDPDKPKCPECNSQGRKIGKRKYKTKNVQRYRCRDISCNKNWQVPIRADSNKSDKNGEG